MNRLKIKRILSMLAILTITLAPMASANKIGDSNLGRGLLQMLNDGSKVAYAVLTAGTVLYIIYSIVKKLWTDVHEAEAINRRIGTTLMWYVIGLCASGVIDLVTSYFI